MEKGKERREKEGERNEVVKNKPFDERNVYYTVREKKIQAKEKKELIVINNKTN